MQVHRGLKWRVAEYETESFLIGVSHEELGLPTPTDDKSAYDTAARLSYHVKALLTLEEVKLGRVHPSQIADTLKNFIPTGTILKIEETKQ